MTELPEDALHPQEPVPNSDHTTPRTEFTPTERLPAPPPLDEG